MSASKVKACNDHVAQHGAIFRASFFTGGAQVVSSLASLARAKFIALILGVAGVGANGLLFQAFGLIQAALGFGIASSGIRAVANAHALGDRRLLSRTVRALRVWVWLTGGLSLAACTCFSSQLSALTFGTEEHARDFIILGFAAFIQQISSGQAALLRGMRKIRELAVMNIAAALTSLLLAAPCFWLFGIHGIAISLLLAASVSLVCSWWLARRVELEAVPLTREDIMAEGRELLSAGMAFVGTALAGGAVGYASALLVRRHLGLEGNGYYQAGMGITIVLVGFVLAAMGQDYYPKLVALLRQGESISRHIQDQVDMALLMATPLLVAVSSLAPWVLHIAYSDQFSGATGVVTWLALASLCRIASWPLGYAVLAEGKNAVILGFEFITACASVAFVYLGVLHGGVQGAAAGFAVSELVHWVLLLAIAAYRFQFFMPLWLVGHLTAAALAITIGRWVGPWMGIPLTLCAVLVCARLVVLRLGPSHRLSKMIKANSVLRRLCAAQTSQTS